MKGIVTGIQGNEVTVDIGTKHTGFIKLDELTDDPSAKIEDIVKKGDELNLIVIKPNDQDGTVELSKKRYRMLSKAQTQLQKQPKQAKQLLQLLLKPLRAALLHL